MSYSGRLNGVLKRAVDAIAETPADQQLGLLEELAMLREVSTVALKGYELAVSSEVTQNKEELMCAATTAVVVCLREVRDTAVAAARIDQSVSGYVSKHTLRALVGRMVRTMYQVCGERHQDLAEEFAKKVERDIQIPTRDAEGTVLTPDQDVLAMDALTVGG